MLSIGRLVKSFSDAFRGIVYVFKNEQNFRIQITVGILILWAIFYFPLRTWETILLILLTIMVLTMELVNSALEHFADIFKPRLHPFVGTIKDIMAGATLLTSLGAFIIGYIILSPYFISLFK